MKKKPVKKTDFESYAEQLLNEAFKKAADEIEKDFCRNAKSEKDYTPAQKKIAKALGIKTKEQIVEILKGKKK